MLAVLEVGESEKHRVEVYSSFWTGLEVIRVDGEEILRKRKFPLWVRDRLSFEVGDVEKHRVELVYRALTLESKAYVDGHLVVGCLFPQVAGLNALAIAIVAVILGLVALVLSLPTALGS